MDLFWFKLYFWVTHEVPEDEEQPYICVAPVLQPVRATSYNALNELFLSRDSFINWRGKPWKESRKQPLMMYS